MKSLEMYHHGASTGMRQLTVAHAVAGGEKTPRKKKKKGKKGKPKKRKSKMKIREIKLWRWALNYLR